MYPIDPVFTWKGEKPWALLSSIIRVIYAGSVVSWPIISSSSRTVNLEVTIISAARVHSPGVSGGQSNGVFLRLVTWSISHGAVQILTGMGTEKPPLILQLQRSQNL